MTEHPHSPSHLPISGGLVTWGRPAGRQGISLGWQTVYSVTYLILTAISQAQWDIGQLWKMECERAQLHNVTFYITNFELCVSRKTI